MNGWPEITVPDDVDLSEMGGTSVDEVDGTVVWTLSDRVHKASGLRESEIENQRTDCHYAVSKAKIQKDEEAEKIAQAAYDVHKAKFTDEDDENPDSWDKVVDWTIVLKREGDHMILVSSDKSQHRIDREKRNAEWNAKDVAERKAYADNDPLIALLMQDKCVTKVGYMGVSLNDKWGGEPNPWFFTINVEEDYNKNHQAKLVWGVISGDVKVEMWVRGKGDIAKPTFPRTPEGIMEAWEAAQQHILSGT